MKEPIDWVLLTSLPVRDLEGAMEVIGYYEKRWLIEEWHKALKTGCQVERRQLHTSRRLEALTGVLSVVAVRLLQMKEVGRREPDRAATDLVPAQYVELVHRARRGRGRPEDVDDPRLHARPGRVGRLHGPQERRRAGLDHHLAGLGRLALDAPGRSSRASTTRLVNRCCG